MNQAEPAPIANDRPAVWDMVIQDMRERDQTGLKKYGTRLQPHNGRKPLVDAYQEVLDLAVYLRQEIEERDGYHFPAITVEASIDDLYDKQTEEHMEWVHAKRDSFEELMEMWDKVHAAETWLRRKAAEGVDIQAAKDAVYRKNLERGYYRER